MKKINSVNFGGKIIAVGMVFLIIFPLSFFLLSRLISYKEIIYAGYLSALLGGLILLTFFLFLGYELRQDKKIDRYVQDHCNIKIAHENGKWECGKCGNRNLRISDAECHVCGVKFETGKFMTVEEILAEK